MNRSVLRLALLLAALPAVSFGQASPDRSRRTFDSPEEAAAAAIHAAERNDATELAAIFGPASRSILSSGNAQQDQQERAEFAKLALSKHQLEKDSLNPHRVILSIGSQDWPFPVPIVKSGNQWGFDAAQGSLEIRARRVGANELDAIEICAGYVKAQQQYAEKVRDEHGMLEYAQRLMGRSDALYTQSGSDNLIPKSFAMAESGAQPKPYHGYYFRILKSQGANASGGAHNYMVQGSMIGGFALFAWPAQYRTSGVHSFIVSQDGVIFEKDLHGATAQVTRYDPDRTWKPVE